MQTKAFQKEWLNPKEVFMNYGLSVSTLAKWRMVNKNLPFAKIGKSVRYRKSDIEAFMESQTVSAANAVAGGKA